MTKKELCGPVTALAVPHGVLLQIFGSRFWNDLDAIYCIPVAMIRPDSQEAVTMDEDRRFAFWRQFQYIIAEEVY